MSFDPTSYIDVKDLLSRAGELAVLISALTFTAFSKRIKEWLEKKANEKFEHSISKTSRVRDLVSEVRAIYKAQRVLLFQLHNGQYYFSGEGADKLSLTHCVVDSGIAVPQRAGTALKFIPTTYWPETFKIMSEKSYFYQKVKDSKDPFLLQMLAVDGVREVIVGPVKDRKGRWLGVLVVCYMDTNDDVPNVEDAAEYGQKLGDLLSF